MAILWERANYDMNSFAAYFPVVMGEHGLRPENQHFGDTDALGHH